jgi:hypothetical protein
MEANLGYIRYHNEGKIGGGHNDYEIRSDCTKYGNRIGILDESTKRIDSRVDPDQEGDTVIGS